MNKTNYLLCVHETIRQILRQIRLQEPAALVVKKSAGSQSIHMVVLPASANTWELTV